MSTRPNHKVIKQIMQKCRGFTLIELSIVLVIIGLIAGGILIGRDLIAASELRSIKSNVEKLQTAIYAFKLKYGGLPGDIPNATAYWPQDADCPHTPANTVTKPDTCDGNNDGIIRYMNAFSDMEEPFRATQQLANAGLIAGQYTGATTTAFPFDYVPGLNMPKLNVRDAGIFFGNSMMPATPIDSQYYPGSYRLIIQPGMYLPSCGWVCGGFLTPSEALGMDQKYDDGKPATGVLRSFKKSFFYTPNCTTSNNPNIAEYNTSRTTKDCLQIYMLEQ